MDWKMLEDKVTEESLEGAIAFLKYQDYCLMDVGGGDGIFDESIPGYLIVALICEGKPDLGIYKKDTLLEAHCKAVQEAKKIAENEDDLLGILRFDLNLHDYL